MNLLKHLIPSCLNHRGENDGIDILLNGGKGTFTLKSVLPDGGGQVTGMWIGGKCVAVMRGTLEL